jgi:hypothetical protein
MRPRFSIRDLLWLTLVVGVCVGWYLEYRRWVALNSQKPLVLRAYHLQNIDGTMMGNVLLPLQQNTPGVRIGVDERYNAVYILGNPEVHDIAKKIIEQLDQKHPSSPSPPSVADDAAPGT